MATPKKFRMPSEVSRGRYNFFAPMQSPAPGPTFRPPRGRRSRVIHVTSAIWPRNGTLSDLIGTSEEMFSHRALGETGNRRRMFMRTLTAGMFVVAAIAVGPAIAQQSMPKRLQKEADKGVKTQNSARICRRSRETGCSRPPAGPAGPRKLAVGTRAAPSAQKSGAGIAGAPGNKDGPPARQGTVGSTSSNVSVQEQDFLK